MGASLYDLLPEHDSAGSGKSLVVDVAFFAEDLTRRNGRATAVVRSAERPVALEYAYSEIRARSGSRCSSCCASASWSEPCSS